MFSQTQCSPHEAHPSAEKTGEDKEIKKANSNAKRTMLLLGNKVADFMERVSRVKAQ
jgi:hypothetical protein